MAAIASLCPEPFSVSVVPDGREIAVVPVGDLDIATADVLDKSVRDVRARGFEHVVIDLRGLHFIDSSGLRVLLSLREAADGDGHGLTLVTGPRCVQRIFELTATSGLFSWREG